MLQARTVVAHTQIAIVEGEAGVGKHLFAQTLHRHSPLAQLPFRRFDAREWLASETEISALKGTIYLDRVDLLASTGQGLLLNLIKSLQDSPPKQFLLLASSHVSLRNLASEGEFLPDLAFRIAAVRFFLPRLRDRREDIAPLAQTLLERICAQYRQPTTFLASGTLQRLLQHNWTGNVRELASTLESAVLESRTGVIRPGDLILQLSTISSTPGAPSNSADTDALDANDAQYSQPVIPGDISKPENLTLNAAVLRHIQYVLERNRGNKLRTARQLGISRSTLYRLLAGGSISSTPGELSRD